MAIYSGFSHQTWPFSIAFLTHPEGIDDDWTGFWYTYPSEQWKKISKPHSIESWLIYVDLISLTRDPSTISTGFV